MVVESRTKSSLDGFVEQVKRRIIQGYDRIIVVAINQKQKLSCEKALKAMMNIAVVKFVKFPNIAAGNSDLKELKQME